MKESIICSALIILSSTSFSVAEEHVELLPEVKELITPKPLDPKLLKNNRFIALLGMQHPDDDYYNVAKNIFTGNYNETYQQIIDNLKKLDYSRVELSKIVPDMHEQNLLNWFDPEHLLSTHLFCTKYLDKNCIQKIIEKKDNLQILRADNQQLITRYYEIFNQYPIENFIALPFSYVETPFANYTLLLNIMRVELAYSVVLLSDGQIDQAIESLLSQQKIVKTMMGKDQKVMAIGMLIAMNMEEYLDLYIDALLNSEYAKDLLKNPKFIALMENSESNLHRFAMESIIYDSLLVDADSQYLMTVSDTKIDAQKLSEYFENRRTIFNALTQGYDIEKAEKRFEILCSNMNDPLLSIGCEPIILRYIEMANIQLSYHNMVYLKYLIMKNQVQDEDIPAFLKSQGDLAVNPITQKPFVWSPEERFISLCDIQYQHLPAPIRRTMNDDGEPKMLRVVIPE